MFKREILEQVSIKKASLRFTSGTDSEAIGSSDFLYNSNLYRREGKGMVTGIGRSPTPFVLHLPMFPDCSIGKIRIFY